MSKIFSLLTRKFRVFTFSKNKDYDTYRSDIETRQAILSAIVESSDDAIISKNLDGIITSWNLGAQKLFGYTEQETIGKSITMLIPQSRLAEEYHILRNIKSGKKVNHFQTWRVHKTGRIIPISLTVSPLKDKHGKIIGASKIARDITEQVQAQHALKRNAENLETLNAIGKKISEKLDADSILKHVTAATTKITGAAFGLFFYNTADEDLKDYRIHFSEISHVVADKQLINKLINVLEAQTGKENGIVNISISPEVLAKNHTLFSILPQMESYLAIPIISRAGELLGKLVFGHFKPEAFTLEHESLVESIALQASIALENSILFEQIKALNIKKDEFIALASHELKTPLTTIKGYLQLLNKKAEGSNQVFVEKTLNQVEKLNNLVDQLLDVSKIEAEKLELNLDVIDLKELITEVVESFGYSSKTHKVVFNYSGDEFKIHADKHRLEQVLINLIGNAIKYSPNADTVHVNLRQNLTELIISVKDNGIGLTEVQKEKIFSRFYRVESVKNITGLGLGLYLTKEIINRHNGTIGVNSELGRGSEFYFSLPLSPQASA